ncbi:nucleolus and neural progenitor protein [Mixophyes fleayi]|uniref:nucleolus and neural progenitor protein n=1 Tax=Mixophyes fleayi TaxID=3061075 RepID=UPI003F4E3828
MLSSMASAPWNRVNIPRPAIQCQVTVPLGEITEKSINKLVERCIAAHSSLESKTLNIEVATLDSILYVYHHRLSYHKPYLALKQVQQCTKRIRSMGLEASIQEIMDLCPKKTDLEAASHCSLPSQPIMELVSMKILGACKLLLRLMDCCRKAFHLCLQHLKLQEFIVLNVVLLGLLSRLWVMYRGVLKQLIVLYKIQISVQQEVSEFQKMPYFKDFHFPDKIEDYLGPVFTDLVRGKLPQMFFKKGEPQLLNNIFKTSKLINKEKDLETTEIADLKETKRTFIDLGQPIKMKRLNRDKLEAFDVKALFQPVKANSFQNFSSKQESNMSKNKQIGLSRHRRERKCMKNMLPKIQEAESFKELSDQLLFAVKWCKERKLRNEAVFFRNRYMRSRRLQHAEALGCSLKKKLHCWKKCLCHSLHEQTLNEHHPKACFRIQRFPHTWKFTVTRSRKRKFNECRITYSKAKVKRDLKIDLFPGDEKVSSSATDIALRSQTSEPSVSGTSTKGTDRNLTETDDIDDIFSSIGM